MPIYMSLLSNFEHITAAAHAAIRMELSATYIWALGLIRRISAKRFTKNHTKCSSRINKLYLRFPALLQKVWKLRMALFSRPKEELSQSFSLHRKHLKKHIHSTDIFHVWWLVLTQMLIFLSSSHVWHHRGRCYWCADCLVIIDLCVPPSISQFSQSVQYSA